MCEWPWNLGNFTDNAEGGQMKRKIMTNEK